MCDSDCNPSPDVPSSLSHEPPGGSAAPKLTLAKRRANQQETETYYFTVSDCRVLINASVKLYSGQYRLDIKTDYRPINAVCLWKSDVHDLVHRFILYLITVNH